MVERTLKLTDYLIFLYHHARLHPCKNFVEVSRQNLISKFQHLPGLPHPELSLLVSKISRFGNEEGK